MPYGTISQATEELLKRRAGEGNIPVEKLGLDPEMPSIPDRIPDNLFAISVIVNGALDEDFYVLTDYEVNIADWIAEDLRETARVQESTPNAIEDWEVLVTEVVYEDAGPVRYRVDYRANNFDEGN